MQSDRPKKTRVKWALSHLLGSDQELMKAQLPPYHILSWLRLFFPIPRPESTTHVMSQCSLFSAFYSSVVRASPFPTIGLHDSRRNSPSPIVVISRTGNDGNGRRVWRRRKLTKKDELLQYKLERVPFLEEQVRKIKETGKLLTMDVERLLLSEDNRFDFINEIAAEANEYVENNRDEYGGTKKAILHVISNRVNDMGFERPEAYAETDPYKPGPGYLKEEFT